MKRNRNTTILLYIYGGIITLLGTFSFITEATGLPGFYKLFSLTWIPLLTAFWLWTFNKQLGVSLYWKIAAFAVIVADFALNFIVVPFVIGPAATLDPSAAGMFNPLGDPLANAILMLLPLLVVCAYATLIIPLYVVAFLYAYRKSN
jgi:hypothetical protein